MRLVLIYVTNTQGYAQIGIISDGVLLETDPGNWITITINSSNEIVVENTFGSNLNSWEIKVIIYG